MDSTGNNMKNKIIIYLKYAFGFIFAWTCVILTSTACYMYAFHSNDHISIWPKTVNFTIFLSSLLVFSGMWFIIFLLMDIFIVHKK